jgi:FkbM family methyltransferase
MSTLFRTVSGMLKHPLGRIERMATLRRFVRWQVGSRILGMPVAAPWIDGTRLLVSTGMRGATMNLYVGLQEFEDMGFTLHLLSPGDGFVDVGANVGVYSVLAGSRGAWGLAFEPVPSAYQVLMDNLRLNGLCDRFDARNVGVGGEVGQLRFTVNGGPTNHVLTSEEVDEDSVAVPVRPLAELVGGRAPLMIKVDVEGFESEVIRGGIEVLSQASLMAILIELNGLGGRYGFRDSDNHDSLVGLGFRPVRYDPFHRTLAKLDNHRTSGNTLYVRDAGALSVRLRNAAPFRWGNVEI